MYTATRRIYTATICRTSRLGRLIQMAAMALRVAPDVAAKAARAPVHHAAAVRATEGHMVDQVGTSTVVAKVVVRGSGRPATSEDDHSFPTLALTQMTTSLIQMASIKLHGCESKIRQSN
jgi:hypothetical protein